MIVEKFTLVQVFDRINQFLLAIFTAIGFKPQFRIWIYFYYMILVEVNSFMFTSIRQGSPLSLMLYVFTLEPHL